MWRPLLFVAGMVAIVLLVRSVGPAAVLAALRDAGPWLPLVFALEVAWIFVEGGALLILLGDSRRAVPLRELLGAFLVHMSTMLVLPVGRAGAEVARATLLSKHVGAAKAMAASTLMQALTLIANTVISLACAGVVWMTTSAANLSLFLLVNGVATLVLGGAMLLTLLHVRLGGLVGRRFGRFAELGPEVDREIQLSRGRHGVALGFCVLARLVQTLQYGVMLLAVTSAFSVARTFVAQGIHLVGAGLGDMVPNQVGVTEGVFRFFAPALGLADAPERALSVALLARVSVLGVAALGVIALQLFPRVPTPTDATPADVSARS